MNRSADLRLPLGDQSATWRPIAIHNGIDDPRALDIGQRLEIPRLPFRDPETGEVMR